MANAAFEQAMIAVAEPVEMVFEPLLHAHKWVRRLRRLPRNLFGSRLEQIFGHGGHERSGEQIRGEHGERDGFGERNEQVPRDAGEKEHGHEHDANGERGNQRRHGDLRSAIQDGLNDFLALVNVAIDVFDFDGGVVHQNADGERETAEGHDVDRLAERAQNDQRSEDRERNRDRDDQRAAPAAQENQDHESGQAGGDDALRGPRQRIEAFTKMDWSESGVIFSAGGRPAAIVGSSALTPEMMSSVEASPAFKMIISEER